MMGWRLRASEICLSSLSITFGCLRLSVEYVDPCQFSLRPYKLSGTCGEQASARPAN